MAFCKEEPYADLNLDSCLGAALFGGTSCFGETAIIASSGLEMNNCVKKETDSAEFIETSDSVLCMSETGCNVIEDNVQYVIDSLNVSHKKELQPIVSEVDCLKGNSLDLHLRMTDISAQVNLDARKYAVRILDDFDENRNVLAVETVEDCHEMPLLISKHSENQNRFKSKFYDSVRGYFHERMNNTDPQCQQLPDETAERSFIPGGNSMQPFVILHKFMPNRSNMKDVNNTTAEAFTDTKQRLAETVIVDKPYTCKQCLKVFTIVSYSTVLRHTKKHVKDGQGRCSKVLHHARHNRKQQHENHVATHKETSSDGKPFKCDTCSASFSYLKFLKMHTFIHTGKKPFSCKDCNKSFWVNESLRAHRIKNHGERDTGAERSMPRLEPFFMQDWNTKSLDQHVTDDNKSRLKMERRYVCYECEMAFVQKGSLFKHLCKHEGYQQVKQKYRCPECLKDFSTKKYVAVHIMTIHRKAKNHICHVCGKRFIHETSLLAHEKAHGPKQVECAICHMKFHMKSELKKHMHVRHTNQK